MNSWVLSITLIVHLLVMWVLVPARPPIWQPTTGSPTLLLTLSGLGGAEMFWNGFHRHLGKSVTQCFECRTQANLRAVHAPMHQQMHESTWPAVKAHCDRWGTDRARVLLVGHSLGGVDAFWLDCALRERYGGKVRTLLLSVAGAFGTDKSTLGYYMGIHRTVVEALKPGSPFLKDLRKRSRSLPHHPQSRAVFFMADGDHMVVPATRSLVYDYPPSHDLEHLVVYGAGHATVVMAAYERLRQEILAFMKSA